MSSKRKAVEAKLEDMTKRLKEASDAITSPLISEAKLEDKTKRLKEANDAITSALISGTELEDKTKRLKEANDAITSVLISEFKCAISHQLPVDPVTAEDGHVYERAAIEKLIAMAKANDRPLTSPKNNTPMGPRLFPSTQMRNIIEEMVRSGTVSGPEAAAWSEKLAKEKRDAAYVARLRAKAEGGDGDAMFQLGMMYDLGEVGLPKDFKQAAVWLRRGHNVNHAACSVVLGANYGTGRGVEKSPLMALYLYTVAAQNGSEHACFCMGKDFAYGHCGMKKDEQEAARWFTAMKTASKRDSCDEDRADAAEWLREHAAE